MYLSDSSKGPRFDAGSTEVTSSVLGQMWPSDMKGQKSQPVRVFLVDEDSHIRNVISQELMRDPRTILVGQASSYREARKGIFAQEFDVLLIDLSLSEGQGADLLELVQLRMPGVLSIAISSSEKDDVAMDAFKKGVVGYLLKNSWFGSYSQAVLEVANGGASISPIVAKKILPKIFQASIPEENPLEYKNYEPLTEREKEVLRLIAQGKRTHEIGSYLKISTLTVSTHVKNIYRKMQVRTRAQAVRYAVLKGII
ncbi:MULTISPECIES: LuxR C-terminal-related transcriptional regulator [Comamonas]|jgi:DNA-binding NarL/FixJ family response regulator|uniref:LuxR C-terminal-related transcriptional regulator n=1 Tax=Comamonas TaxID=283 RepID=UPI0012C38E1E|nr:MULTISPECIES: response regulator transcription factor [Comamonas]MDR3066128.1 response regulator transcription factor [Comamonas sp.]MEB5964001.1 response regulator transcription factor [Comamonas testosteroni]MPS91164.1 response regulator transcription factor [Comamonas sp.]